MISRIGRKSRNSRVKAAFTLIELIIVAAIISALIAVSSPLFRETFRDLELKDAAYNVSKIIRYGQQRAIIEENRYRLLFDFENGSYRLQIEVEKEEVREPSGDEEDEGGPEKVIVRSWEAIEGRFSEAIHLPESISFNGTGESITFLPNGRCEKVSIFVCDRRKNVMEIATNGRAGYVGVSEVKE